ncbi:enoyl-CoA hydratase/isomerase family protein [Nocardia bovistercoris]|uniref:Enoyl-CoA hydratase/isomerase family protein n=1 Tax=Nocardia bovistercoris TaxID=2785916 RepID=A0A931N3G3_9NOCA|nr:enoyl-CoA hydratase/isomerase family protein [Nocardia bovistercoris]MBH0777126.1 enoyl-CoA hydratase/isomerase family protein [Nocardia bovistercoris]
MSDRYAALAVRRERGVAFVTIDHPPVNLVDEVLVADLDRLHGDLVADADTRVVVFQSANPEYFLAHGDMRLITEQAALEAYLAGPGLDLFQRYRDLSQVTIAKITGRSRGGGAEFLLHLDLRYAALENAWFGQPEVSLGIFPGSGGTELLPPLLGRSRALEVILGGGRYDAATAERYGWIDRALPAAELDEFVDDLAHRIAAQPPSAVAAARAAVDAAAPRPESAGARTAELLLPLFTGPDARRRTEAALAAGAQTRAGERDLEGLIERSRVASEAGVPSVG